MTPTIVAVELSRHRLNSTATLQLATATNKSSPLNIPTPNRTGDPLHSFEPTTIRLPVTLRIPYHRQNLASPSRWFARFRSRWFARFKSRRLSVFIGDRRWSRLLSIAIGIDGDASACRTFTMVPFPWLSLIPKSSIALFAWSTCPILSFRSLLYLLFHFFQLVGNYGFVFVLGLYACKDWIFCLNFYMGFESIFGDHVVWEVLEFDLVTWVWIFCFGCFCTSLGVL